MAQMLETGVISSSAGPWASPTVLVEKKEFGFVLIIDSLRTLTHYQESKIVLTTWKGLHSSVPLIFRQGTGKLVFIQTIGTRLHFVPERVFITSM